MLVDTEIELYSHKREISMLCMVLQLVNLGQGVEKLLNDLSNEINSYQFSDIKDE